MKEPITIEGRWHIHGEDQPAYYGQLFCDPIKGLRLEVKESKAVGLSEMFSTNAMHAWNDKSLVIQGFDADNHSVRLFGCCQGNWTEKMGMKTHDFYVHRAVKGLSSGSWAELRSRSYKMTFSILDHWVNPSGRVPETSNPSTDFEFKIGAIQAKLGATRKYNGFNGTRSEEKWIKLIFPIEHNVSKVLNEHAWFLALFLSLLVGDLVGLDEFAFMPEGEAERSFDERLLIQKPPHGGDGRRDKPEFYMRATFKDVAEMLPDLLDRWFSLFRNQDMLQVIKLYSALVHHDLYIGVRFLLLAQALEAYHTACGKFTSTRLPDSEFKILMARVRKSLSTDDHAKLKAALSSANNKSFYDKLIEVIADAPPQIKGVISNPTDFATLVRDNRNAYTHHVGKRSHSKRLSESDLADLAYKAEALLEMLLLRDVGAPIKAFDQIVRENRTAVSIDLSDPAT